MDPASEPFFFTWSAQRSAAALEVTGGNGCHFTTADGKRWLDLASLSYQAALGHGHPRMVEAIAAQARALCLASPSAVYPAKRELAAELLRLAPPGFGKVFFTLGGAEAVENAMKIARLATGRYKFVSRYHGYHGASMGAISLTGDFRRPPVEPGLPGIVRIASDDPELVRQVLELEGPGTVAAVVLEPVTGANGVHASPPGFLAAVRAACDAHGTLLILDEVLTGFGRTGSALALEQHGVVPDMITLAKALTAGYAPLGAVLVSDRLAAKFDDQVLWAGLTSYAHPLGCAAGREALAIYREESLYTRAGQLEPVLLGALRELGGRRPDLVRAVRGLGLLACVELGLDPAGWKRLAAELHRRALFVHDSARRGTIIFAPPLVIARPELEAGLASFAEAVVAAGGRS